MNVPSTIGVISPFALAESILGEKIPWTKMGPEEGREVLEGAFHLDYASLFSPVKGESPLYWGLPGKKTAEKSPPEKKNFGLLSSGTFSTAGGPDTGRRMARMVASLTGTAAGAPPPCTASVTWDERPVEEYPEPPPPSPDSDADFDLLFGTHPIQGCAADCYFIAALASLAWTDPVGLWGYSDGTGNHDFFFSHIDPDLNPVDWQPESVDRNLPLDKDTLAPAFARSRVKGRAWPALYEKAYAIFRQVGPGTEPDITQLNYGNPIEALCMTSMCYGTVRLTAGFQDGAELFSEVNALCGAFQDGNKTRFPMVAWTYPTDPADPGLGYNTDVLAANHAYSILGTMVADGVEHIVMRNPFCFSVAPSIDGVTGGTWKFTDWYCYGGENYLPGCSEKVMDLKTSDGSVGDGTFAIEAGLFPAYFLAFAWAG
ncbi:MAG: C2 family cysteine protease [Methanomicrobiales archaeon]|nr:C2 family cysteine protease [Methanomicrobiales archaeon]